METRIALALPWPAKPAHPPLVPFFLPFQGCPGRCIYCAQDRVSGPFSEPLPVRLARLRAELSSREGPIPELAFYGGTFTALPEADFVTALVWARILLEEGRICGLRCSTRPDALSHTRLRALKEAGCTTIELGIQSFADHVLCAARRGYTGRMAIDACKRVRTYGFHLGVQLLPGLPESRQKDFCADVTTALACGAELLRFYPCLVLRGTALARLYAAGHFCPWDLPTTLEALAQGLLRAQEAAVPVIRMGLAPDGMADAVLAGPYHPSLGARVQARALFLAVSRAIAPYYTARVFSVRAPRFVQGFFWGDGGEMRAVWQGLGISPDIVHFCARSTLVLTLAL